MKASGENSLYSPTSQLKAAVQGSSILQAPLESLLEIGDLLLSGFPEGSAYHGQKAQQDLLDMLRSRMGTFCGAWAMVLLRWCQTPMSEICACPDRHPPPPSARKGRGIARGCINMQPTFIYWEIPRDINVNNNANYTYKVKGLWYWDTYFSCKKFGQSMLLANSERRRNLQECSDRNDSVYLDFYINKISQDQYFKKHRFHIRSACGGTWYLRVHIQVNVPLGKLGQTLPTKC